MTDSAVGSGEAVSTIDGGPELVQLLTPEGERVEHPEYAVRRAPGRRRPARAVPRPGAGAPRRRRGHRAAAPGRAGPLGQPARPGGGADRLRPRPARRGLRLPDLPRARRRLVPRRRPAEPARHVPRRQPRRLGPERATNFHLYTIVIGAQTLHATGYAMGIQRDGAVGTGEPDRDAAVIAYFGDGATSAGRRQRGVRLRRRATTPPSCSSARTTSGRSPSPASGRPAIPLYQRAPGLRLPRRPRRRQRRAGRVRRDQGRRWSGPAPARARRSSRRSPTGWARTPPPTTRPATAPPPRSRCGSERDPIARLRGLPGARTALADDGVLRRAARPRATSWRRTCARAVRAMPDPDAAGDLRPRLRRRRTRWSTQERAQFAAYLDVVRRAAEGGH